MLLGARLKNVRKSRGYTIQELADLYNKAYGDNISRGTLSKYENDKQKPLLSVISNLASILNIEIDYLLTEQDIITDSNPISSDFNSFEYELILKYRTLNNNDKQLVNRILQLNDFSIGGVTCPQRIYQKGNHIGEGKHF